MATFHNPSKPRRNRDVGVVEDRVEEISIRRDQLARAVERRRVLDRLESNDAHPAAEATEIEGHVPAALDAIHRGDDQAHSRNGDVHHLGAHGDRRRAEHRTARHEELDVSRRLDAACQPSLSRLAVHLLIVGIPGEGVESSAPVARCPVPATRPATSATRAGAASAVTPASSTCQRGRPGDRPRR